MKTKRKCQCPTRGRQAMPDSWYHPTKELPFVNHEPNECKCNNELKLYERDGKKLWLCSCCCLSGDKEITNLKRQDDEN